MYYFRDKRKREADIVRGRRNAEVIGIEVKVPASVKTQDFRGLITLVEFAGKAFKANESAGLAWSIFSYAGKAAKLHSSISMRP